MRCAPRSRVGPPCCALHLRSRGPMWESCRAMPTTTDEGYFPRSSSTLRMVHEEKAVGLMYGQRALCVGAVKPLNYVGTSEHTRNKRTPFRRISHTGGMCEEVFFGTRAQADRVLTMVDGMHERVVGELPHDAGPHYP